MTTLAELAATMTSGHHVTKPKAYYDIYDRTFGHLASRPINLLEIGVFEGESTKVFARYFGSSTILGIDLALKDIDFSGFPNVRYRQCSQTDGPALQRLVHETFPEGVDIIIDDASHIGFYSRITFDALYPLLKPGGFYVVEDWGTGYWDGWPDGSRYQPFSTAPFDGGIPKRLPSHDVGMVGFVKSLVDEVGCADFGTDQFSAVKYPQRFESLHFHRGICIGVKPG